MSVDRRVLLGVYPDRERAEQVAQAVTKAGVDPTAVHVGDPHDEVVSLQAEMDEEVADSWGSPAAPLIVTKEMAKGGMVAGAIGAVVGGLLALIPAFLLDWGSVSSAVSIGVTVVIGMVFGLTVGWVVGGGWSERRDAGLAAERGVPVRVETASKEVVAVMSTPDVLRLDELDNQQRVRTVTTEERRVVHNPLEDVAEATKELGTEIAHGDERGPDRSPR